MISCGEILEISISGEGVFGEKSQAKIWVTSSNAFKGIFEEETCHLLFVY
jgi:hypothetical protein